jgi:hypothetical protein
MQQVTQRLVDDLDPTGETAADETILWSFAGLDMTIDLSQLNAETLRAILAPYLAASRRVEGPAGRRKASSMRKDQREARTWLQSHGHVVPARGRLSAELLVKGQ